MSTYYTSPRTIRVQFESPLSHVKTRIDEIHSVIEQNAFIKPMISTAGVRRTLFADAVSNTRKVEDQIRAAVVAKLGGPQDLPVLPVSSPSVAGSSQGSSSVNAREEAKLTGGLSSAQLEAKKRFEKRKTFHRNCIPHEKRNEQFPHNKVPAVKEFTDLPMSPTVSVPRDLPVAREGGTSPVQVNRHSRAVSPMKQFVSVGVSPMRHSRAPMHELPVRVERVPPAAIEKGIAGLEQLIQDTHQLLQQEGLVDHGDVLPQDLVEEIERDIDALTKKPAGIRSSKNLQELETELEDLINKKI